MVYERRSFSMMLLTEKNTTIKLLSGDEGVKSIALSKHVWHMDKKCSLNHRA